MCLPLSEEAGVGRAPATPCLRFACKPDVAEFCKQVLEHHRDEVWHVQFSHSGTMLASASKDCSALVWRVTPAGGAMLMHTLAGHAKPVVFLVWSPDDCRLLTCCSGQEVWLLPSLLRAAPDSSQGGSHLSASLSLQRRQMSCLREAQNSVCKYATSCHTASTRSRSSVRS